MCTSEEEKLILKKYAYVGRFIIYGYVELLEDMYVWCFGVVIAINMPIMSVTAVQIATQSNTILKVIKYSMYGSGQVLHLFFDCFLSQQLTDFSTAIQKHLTYSNWYDMSVKTQKLAVLVTLRTQEPCRLTAGQIVPLSMETFCTPHQISDSANKDQLYSLGTQVTVT
ncbi:hypothetical protein PV326_005720 [Microctonus aethiopoides]|nr:hypothetical protein PV326_005720 [Microctonus aethiopoides]